jgi:tryptophanase
MNALARGLYEGTEYEFLESRIRQVGNLAEKMKNFGVPLVEPTGGHAVFIDAVSFLQHIPREQFPGQLLNTEFYLEAGIRGSEIGTLMADRDPATRENRFPAAEYVRLAVPRRVYSDNHMNYVATAVGNVFQRRDSLKKGFKITREAPILRHFTVELERL